jgi:hypothetical protein
MRNDLSREETMTRHLVNVMDRDETNSEIVDRLNANWERCGMTIGEPLKRLISCLDSGEAINLSGIDRDLIVYALAFTQAFTAHQRS